MILLLAVLVAVAVHIVVGARRQRRMDLIGRNPNRFKLGREE